VRLGILGGTFDPVHIGHLVVANEARFALGLDRMLLVVANDPWQKSAEGELTPAGDRFALVAAAVSGTEGLEASRIELERGGPSYMVDTARQLAASFPGAELFLVVGADVVTGLDTWHRVEDLAPLVTLVVAERGGVETVPDPEGWNVVRLPVPGLDVSSSDLRRRLAEGAPVDFLIPPAAIRCIVRRGLYAVHR